MKNWKIVTLVITLAAVVAMVCIAGCTRKQRATTASDVAAGKELPTTVLLPGHLYHESGMDHGTPYLVTKKDGGGIDPDLYFFWSFSS